jgi:CRISPR-associated protein Csm2
MDVINSKDYVDKAEAVITGLIEEAKHDRVKILTTSQLRKQLAMTAELFSQAENELSEALSQDIQDKIEYLRVQFVYQAGREPTVKKFLEKAGILQILKSIKGNRESFLTFCRYMEALVAYKKYYDKDDK